MSVARASLYVMKEGSNYQAKSKKQTNKNIALICVLTFLYLQITKLFEVQGHFIQIHCFPGLNQVETAQKVLIFLTFFPCTLFTLFFFSSSSNAHKYLALEKI